MKTRKNLGFEDGKSSSPLLKKGILPTADKTPLPVLEHKNGGQRHGR
ncbi:MAG: hypothetical protein K6A93_05865 [Bacteroidaceae bacterium]|nr:hypothetical protein [Bacteroidaceae bacterium]